MNTVIEATVTFAKPWSITVENNGYETIYVPREFGAVFTKNTKYDRHFVAFKSRRGAERFLLKHGATVENTETEQAPEPIRVIKWIGGRYQTVTVTREQIKQSQRRALYVQEFNPCEVA